MIYVATGVFYLTLSFIVIVKVQSNSVVTNTQGPFVKSVNSL